MAEIRPASAARDRLFDLNRPDFTKKLPLPKDDYAAANVLVIFSMKYARSTGDAKLTPKEMDLVKTSVALIKAGEHPEKAWMLQEAREALKGLIDAGARKGTDVAELTKLARGIKAG